MKTTKLRRIPVSRQDSQNSLAKLQSMDERLDKTFAVWKKDALALMKCEEDELFLKSMKSDRAASFGGVDKKKVDKDKRKEKSLREEALGQERHESANKQEMKSYIWSDDSTSSDKRK